MAVTVGAVVAMLVMAALAVVAITARREAERQRVEAEGLVEFMLTDLRTRLRGVGRLDVMRAVNQRALEHYDILRGRGDRSPHTQLQRARVLQAIGEDDIARGDLSAALELFREAGRLTAPLAVQAPDDADRIFAQAQSEYWMGHIDDLRGNHAAAHAAYQHYRGLASHMNRLVPNNPRFLGELAYAESNLGIVNLNGLGRPAIARGHFQASLRWFEMLTRIQPANRTWREESADAHAWLADTWFNERRYREARSERLTEQRMKLSLSAQEPDNRAYSYALVVTARSLARIDMELHDFEQAVDLLNDTRPEMMELLALDPDNLVWRNQAIRIEIDRSRSYASMGDGRRSREALRSARALIVEGERLRQTSDEFGRLRTWVYDQPIQ
jgi:tetratricopeptide (TPR) repeat protein